MRERTENLVTSFIPVEKFGRLSIVQMDFIAEVVKETKIKFDGVFTLVEDEGPLVSYLAKIFKLAGNRFDSVLF